MSEEIWRETAERRRLGVLPRKSTARWAPYIKYTVWGYQVDRAMSSLAWLAGHDSERFSMEKELCENFKYHCIGFFIRDANVTGLVASLTKQENLLFLKAFAMWFFKPLRPISFDGAPLIDYFSECVQWVDEFETHDIELLREFVNSGKADGLSHWDIGEHIGLDGERVDALWSHLRGND